MNNYYLYKHNFHNALITNDSLIKYAWMTSQSNVPGLLDINSQIYEAMDDNKNAFNLFTQLLNCCLNKLKAFFLRTHLKKPFSNTLLISHSVNKKLY